MDIIHFLQSLQSDELTTFFKFITFFGDETFYVLVLPILFWIWNRDKSAKLFIVVMFSLLINFWLKEIFQIPRPLGTALIEQGGFSFPSGHAQGSATLWILLIFMIKKRWMIFTAVSMIFLVALSRVYLGVHFPVDILGGWIVAGLIVSIYQKFALTISDYLNEKSKYQRSIYIITILILMAMVYPHNESMTIIGALTGFILMRIVTVDKYYDIPNSIIRKILIVLTGIIGILILWKGLKMILPEHELFRFLRYSFIGAWIPINTILYKNK